MTGDRYYAPGGEPAEDSQSWFWAREWQDGEIEATRQAEAGEGIVYESGDEFLSSLNPKPTQGSDQ